MEVLKKMRETLSFDEEGAQGNAKAVASVVKAWDSAQERIRVLKGEPQPGQKRPFPDQPKAKTTKRLNLPPLDP